MAIQNPWVGYVTRSYQQVKDSLITRLSTSNPEITDHSESNILVIIISMFAGVTEMLNYYIDNMAREAFVATARKFTSMVKLVKLLDYRIKAAYPSTVDLNFTFNAVLTGPGVIPAGTLVKTANNVPFITVQNLNLLTGTISGTIGAKQVSNITGQTLGTTTGIANEPFAFVLVGQYYVDSTAIVKVDGVLYTQVSSLGLSTPTDKHYIVEIDVDGLAYVVFGNGTNGIIPPTGKLVVADFDVTQATLGNVDANTIKTIVSTITLPGVSTVTVNNALAASGGSNYEDIERIRVNAPLSIRTLDRAVTRQDYVDITRLCPGVGRAEVDFNCGKTVKIYIVPEGGGIAQSPLIASAASFVEQRKMITTFIEVSAAGETNLTMALNVTAKFRADPVQTLADVTNALVDYGSYNKQNINKKTRVSDIIALIDNLEKVEFIDLVGLGTKPYARPSDHNMQLTWTRVSLSTSLVKSVWRLEFTGGTTFNVIKDSAFLGTATVNTLWTDPGGSIEFTIQAAAYVVGQVWTFTVYPWNKNIEFDDFTMPKVNSADLIINITEQLTPPIE